MTRERYNLLRLAGLQMAAALSMSCGKPDPRPPESITGVAQMLLAEQLSLRLTSERDSVLAGQGVRVTYIVRNDGPVGRFRNDPGWLYFEVFDGDGHSVTPVRPPEYPHYGSRPDVVLPNGGFFGATVNLACAAWQYGVLPDSSCAFAFPLHASGEYKVLVRYSPSAGAAGELGDGASAEVDLVDSVRVVVSPPLTAP